jgi:hypothetical protein
MNEMIVGTANQLIESGNSGDGLQLAVSQRPSLFFDNSPSAGTIGAADQKFMTAYVHAAQMWMNEVWQFQMEAQRTQFRWTETVIRLTNSVGLIQEKLDGLTATLDRLAEQRTFVVPLTTLAPEPMQLRLNIPATIEGDGEDFTATFTEANVSASGETAADALANLKASLVSTFEFLESLPASERGPLPERQWEVLRNALTR